MKKVICSNFFVFYKTILENNIHFDLQVLLHKDLQEKFQFEFRLRRNHSQSICHTFALPNLFYMLKTLKKKFKVWAESGFPQEIRNINFPSSFVLSPLYCDPKLPCFVLESLIYVFLNPFRNSSKAT